MKVINVKMKHKIFKNSNLPFMELRYAKNVVGCTKSHTHESIMLTAISNGEANLILKNKIKKLSYGKIAFLNPNTLHHLEILNETSEDSFVLHLNKDWCVKIQKELFSHDVYIPISKIIIEDIFIYNNFILLCNQLFSKISLLEKEEKSIAFMLNIFQLYCDTNNIMKNISINKKCISMQIKNYIDINLQREITLSELSSKFNLSAVHIIRLFKKEFDLPIHSYILTKKVHKARELLSTNLSIINVALESGFYDQSHLNKSFKRIFSITPKEYKENLSEC